MDSAGAPRCPSGESMFSDRGGLLRSVPLGPAALSPVGVALPPTLPAAAAAALLPPQSAAMAAYLNAAAAHRLMIASPLPPQYNRSSVSPLVSSSSSPPGLLLNPIASNSPPLQSPDAAILDFSSKRSKMEHLSSETEEVINLSKPGTPNEIPANSPLDLSVTNRKRGTDDVDTVQPPSRKARTSDYKPQILPQWASPVAASHLPYFAAAVAAANSLSPKAATNSSDLWNGKLKPTTAPSEATKALEKMSELSKLGGDDLFRTMANSSASVNSASSRHSAWQSHWLNKGAEQAKDVLKCVWCKQSFPSLQALTTHMKEAKHCGVNVPVPPMQSSQTMQSHQSSQNSSSPSNASSNSSTSNKPNQSDLNLLIKETMPLPRKLVRGQDVWLGKGAEQTRQILKCMWCGQSFRSLAEMTSHMQQTQHYTNIISQEQIISWRSTEDSKGGGGGGSGGSNQSGGGPPGSASSHVSAVLTCKVCDQAFSSLKELSNHMVKNSHYKEHIMRSITESGGRRRQTREKRKKSLPVRKLLELERAQHDFKNGENGVGSIMEKVVRGDTTAGRITCEKCGNKIETSLFVDHIRQCVGGGSLGNNQRNFLKNALMSSSNILIPEKDRKSNNNKSPSPVSQTRSPSATDLSKDTPTTTTESNNGSSPSVLNAIEKLIEKSFDSRGRQNAFPGAHSATTAPMGSSILKRLGIDESVDYTKPLVDPQTMNILRNYHNSQSTPYGRRERSGSESSSISERGGDRSSSRIDSLTPERKMEPPGSHHLSTPRSTPDKRDKSPISDKIAEEIEIKKEIEEDEKQDHVPQREALVTIKKEEECPDEDDRSSYHSNTIKDIKEEDEETTKRGISGNNPPNESGSVQPANSPCRNSTCSPASSDRSATPRSTNGDNRKSGSGGSLGALSSMFDSLSGVGTANDNAGNNTGKRGSSHPLAALQKLCDKTETTHHTNTTRTNSNSSASSASVANNQTNTQTNAAITNTTTTPGAILAFSWACNDAVMTSDSIMKCAFCDTPFISKGAYRHHLSKMHFVKDGVIPDPVALKAATQQHQQQQQPSGSGMTMNTKSSTSVPNVMPPINSESKSPPVTSNSNNSGNSGNFEESPHSKFLKYTELAKQLSSKYV